jgi:hypothetical protein
VRGTAARQALGRVGTPEFQAADLGLLQQQLQVDGVSAEVEQMISDNVEVALSALEDPSLDPAGVAELTRMAQQIAWRDQ